MSLTKGTDKFDARVRVLERSAPAAELSAAKRLYERMRTARDIAESLLTKPTSSHVLAVLHELSEDVRCAANAEGMASRSTSTVEGDEA